MHRIVPLPAICPCTRDSALARFHQCFSACKLPRVVDRRCPSPANYRQMVSCFPACSAVWGPNREAAGRLMGRYRGPTFPFCARDQARRIAVRPYKRSLLATLIYLRQCDMACIQPLSPTPVLSSTGKCMIHCAMRSSESFAASSSHKMLNKNGERQRGCVAQEIRVHVFSLSPLRRLTIALYS